MSAPPEVRTGTANDRYEQVARAFRVLADPMRLRVLGILAEAPETGVGVAGRLGLTPATVSHHLSRLQKAGLVTATADGTSKRFALDTAFFDPKTLAPTKPVAEGHGEPAERERQRTLRNFFEGRRLKTIPARRKQLLIVIQELLTWFEPNRDYREREVNAILREAHEDVATLRRELVDYSYLRRSDGVYRISEALPERSVQLAQEMTGNEREWLDRLLTRATRHAIEQTRGQSLSTEGESKTLRR